MATRRLHMDAKAARSGRISPFSQAVARGAWAAWLLFSFSANAFGGVQAALDSVMPPRTFDIVVTNYSEQRPIRRIRAVMHVEGARCRILTYWLSPPQITETTDHLACADMILDKTHFWCRVRNGSGGSQLFESDLSERRFLTESLNENDMTHLVSTILAIARDAACGGSTEDREFVGMRSFFSGCEGRREFEFLVRATREQRTGSDERSPNGSTLMSQPPSGRVYRKTAVSDELTVWSLSDALDGRPRVSVAVHPSDAVRDVNAESFFEPQSLGNLDLIPEPYRQFWRFERRCAEIEKKGGDPCDASALCREVAAWSACGSSHDTLVALCQVRLSAALMASNVDSISQAVQAYLSALLKDETSSMQETFIGLQHISTELARRCSEGGRRRVVGAAIARLSAYAAFENPYFVQDMLNLAIGQGDHFYAELWIDALRRREQIDGKIIDRLGRHLEMRRLSTSTDVSGDAPLSESARNYIKYLDAPSPRGDLTLADLQDVLSSGFVRRFPTEAAEDRKTRFVAQMLGNIRAVGGEGPFQGEPVHLRAAIGAFDQLYHPTLVSDEQVQVVLSTLLLLSFRDRSTSADHEELKQQLNALFDDIARGLGTILSEYEFVGSAERNEFKDTLLRHRSNISGFVDGALWPMFKYPLSNNERTRVLGTAGQQMEELREFLAHVSSAATRDDRWKRRTLVELRAYVSRVAISVPVGVVIARLPPNVGFGYQCADNGRPRLMARFSYKDPNEVAR